MQKHRYGGLNYNGPHRLLCLGTWCVLGETVCGELDVSRRGGLLGWKGILPFPVSSFCSFI